MVYATALITALSMLTFLGIVCWAWSAHRREANSESAWLPFALADEFGPEQQDGAK